MRGLSQVSKEFLLSFFSKILRACSQSLRTSLLTTVNPLNLKNACTPKKSSFYLEVILGVD
jgi:hypothetical protein